MRGVGRLRRFERFVRFLGFNEFKRFNKFKRLEVFSASAFWFFKNEFYLCFGAGFQTGVY